MRRASGIFIGLVVCAGLAWAGPGQAAAKDPAWMKAPVVPQLGKKDQAKLRARVMAGRKLGMRAGVFAKIGDSNTEFSPDLYGLACKAPRGLPAPLRKTRARYNRVRLPNPRAHPGCRPWTSFSRRSEAAQAGIYSSWSVSLVKDLPDSGYLMKPSGCSLEVTPLGCEVDATRPRYALVLVGTNDLGMDLYFGIQPGSEIGNRLGEVVKSLLARRVVPVLSTIPPIFHGDPAIQTAFVAGIRRTNAGIWRLARERRLPMINLWRALNGPGMINSGMSSDGYHLSVFGAGQEPVASRPFETTFADSVDFSRQALRYGANRRNLIWLKTLAALDRITG